MSLFTSSTRATVAYFLAIFISLGGLASLHDHGALAAMSERNISKDTSNAEFSWDMLPPAKEIDWRKCFPGLQCARLIVPLDYADPLGAEAVIALIRKPSTLAESSTEYKGPILFNPGGPGGSGVEFIQTDGDLLSTIIGPQFDIVSFDPRGIGESTPRVAFFKSSAERAIWNSSVLHIAEYDVANKWASAVLLGKLAEDRDHDGYLKHINTDQTARDMLRIVEAHGRTKIQYWGISYGTILGAVFASMFPDNIERLLIDGVVDSDNYFANLWSNNLLDTEKTMDSFYTGCADAGPDHCAFWAPSPDDIRQNLTNIYDSIKVQPVPVKTGSTYGYVDYTMLHLFVFQSLYFPITTFPLLAQALADLAVGNGTIVLEWMTPPPFECSVDSSKDLVENGIESEIAVICNDAANIPADLRSTQNYFEMMSNLSEFGDMWAAITRVHCTGWPKFPKNHFQGPFMANTSHPIFLISNTADPVTPLPGAIKMSRGFSNSIVLTQNSSGHSSLSAPSLCTSKYVRQYFTDGTLPKPGTICEVDLKPFDPVKEEGSTEDARGRHMDNMNEEDLQLLSAIRELTLHRNLKRFY